MRKTPINEVGLYRFRLLVEEAGGRRQCGERIGMEPGLVAQYVGKTPKKSVGHDVAARLEKAFRKPQGWMTWPEGYEGPTKRADTNTQAIDRNEYIQESAKQIPSINIKSTRLPNTRTAIVRRIEALQEAWRPGVDDAGAESASAVATFNVRVDTVISDKAFAYVVLDDSLMPDFRPGTEFLFDVSKPPKSGMPVVAEVNGETVLRIYKPLVGGGFLLHLPGQDRTRDDLRSDQYNITKIAGMVLAQFYG